MLQHFLFVCVYWYAEAALVYHSMKICTQVYWYTGNTLQLFVHHSAMTLGSECLFDEFTFITL